MKIILILLKYASVNNYTDVAYFSCLIGFLKLKGNFFAIAIHMYTQITSLIFKCCLLFKSKGYPSDTMGPVVVPRSCQWSPNHTIRQCRPSNNSHGRLGAVHTNATLLKPAKHCHSLIRALQGHKKPSGKANMAIYSYSVVVSG